MSSDSAVNDTMITRQGHLHNRADMDAAVNHHRALFDLPHRKDCAVRLVDDRREMIHTERTQIGYRERIARVIVGHQFACEC